jgi:hypothetical protein
VNEYEVRSLVVTRVAVDVVQLAGAARDQLAAVDAAAVLLARKPGAVAFGLVPVHLARRVARRPTRVCSASSAMDGDARTAGLGTDAGCSSHPLIVRQGQAAASASESESVLLHILGGMAEQADASNPVSCPQCGASRPPETATTVPPPPCPECGETGIALQLGAAEEVDIAEAVEVALRPPYEGWGWKQRWEGAQEDLGRVMNRHPEELSGAAIQAAYRELQSFYVRTYHIKDALKKDAASLGLQPRAIEDAITNDSGLALLADLANLYKHFKLTMDPRSGEVPKIVPPVGVRSGSEEGGWRLRVPIDHKDKRLDGLDVAQAAVEAWRRHLRGWGLI